MRKVFAGKMKVILECCFVIIFAGFTLSSCVSNSELAYINDQINDINRRIKNIQKTIDKELDTKLNPIRSNQAELGAEMEGLKTEVRRLSGRVEDNDKIISRAVERDLSEQDNLKSSVTTLSEKVKELETVVLHQQEYLGLELLKPKVAQIEGGDAATGEIKVPIPVEIDEDGLYDQALIAFKEGKLENAMEGFGAFLAQYPKSDRADNAQFWIGECYSTLRQYRKAILAYDKVIKKYPKGNKVPAAMLKQALAFLEIKDKTSTKLILKGIIKKYPKSNEAQIARNKIKNL